MGMYVFDVPEQSFKIIKLGYFVLEKIKITDIRLKGCIRFTVMKLIGQGTVS